LKSSSPNFYCSAKQGLTVYGSVFRKIIFEVYLSFLNPKAAAASGLSLIATIQVVVITPC